MEVVKTRLAVSHPGTYSGIANCARTIIKYEGVRALYNGLRASNLGIIPYAGVGAYFAIVYNCLSISKNVVCLVLSKMAFRSRLFFFIIVMLYNRFGGLRDVESKVEEGARRC